MAGHLPLFILFSMRWSLPFLLSLLPLGALAGKLRTRQCKQSSLKSSNATSSKSPNATSAKSPNTTNASNAKNNVRKFTLQDMYQGQSFLSNDWQFYTDGDPTHGLVNYQSREDAIRKNLAVVQDGVTTLSADDTTKLNVGGMRDSIRVTSTKSYNKGLFVADFEAMPTGCSLWPAYWSVGPNWPNAGEVDIIEGVNNQATNQMTLHSGPDCSMPQDANTSGRGRTLSTSCPTTSTSNSGCAVLDSSTQSFGEGFNSVGGGVFAHRWDQTGIFIWEFPRSSIPPDITAKNPDPSLWGPPVASFPSTNCDINSHFFQHSLVIDTTICGDWAGAAYSGSGCPGTCAEAVADPTNFKNAKWKVNYIAVYQSL